jgi:hypothetical protein
MRKDNLAGIPNAHFGLDHDGRGNDEFAASVTDGVHSQNFSKI